MSIIKGKPEYKTILDFSIKKISKNSVRQLLRKTEFVQLHKQQGSTVLVINCIKVGMYQIALRMRGDLRIERKKLREYGEFKISIEEIGSLRKINLLSDSRFKDQYWTKLNKDSKIRINNLIDIIIYLRRLDNLKAFL